MILEELFDYKNLLMKELCGNTAIVQMLTGNDDAAVPNHGLPYTQVYPFEFVPETVDDAKTFVCFDVDIASVPNETFYVPVLYVWVFTHKSLLRMPKGGLLLDSIAIELDKMLSGHRYYGMGKLKLDSVNRFVPIQDYQGRVLTYYAKDWYKPGQKPTPANRKQGT